ncbi:MAG: hypothetical protein LBR66_09880 [Candidatus Symbiothrix sp.]|jgi:hypothetical protein|nr:hypothetical protein [Candidatus Symbiothrix sp.]
MKKKAIFGMFFAAAMCFSCQQNGIETPEEEEVVYDGSIQQLTAAVYKIEGDTATIQPPMETTISACNINILADEVTEVEQDNHHYYYAFDANTVPGDTLQVVLESHKIGLWTWSWSAGTDNWTVHYPEAWYDDARGHCRQMFSVSKPGTPSRMWISLYPSDELNIKFYTKGNPKPIKEKTLNVKYVGKEILINPADSTLIYPY